MVVNWAILGAYFGLTLWLGHRLGRGQRTLDDYLLAGRRVPWWAASLSIVATETSTLTFIGVPALAYAGDLTFVQVAIGYVFGRGAVAVLLVPGYFRGRFRTAYQLLAERFGGGVQTAASLVFMVSRCLADGVRLFATALVLVALLPMPVPAAILLIAGVTLYYTLRGGLRAVIWNDVVQQGVYLGGAGLAAWILLQRIPGGWAGAARLLGPAGKLVWIDPGWDFSAPYTLWAGLIGGAVLTAATHGTDQMMVQRLLACRSSREGQVALVGSGVLVCAQMAFFLWIGSLLYAFYAHHPPSVPFATADAVFPRFIAEELPVGVGGLVIAAVFAAAMSTLSSSLSALASASTVDFYARRRRPDASAVPAPAAEGNPDEGETLRVSRWMTAGWAVLLAGVAVLARNWGSVLEAGLTITSITFGGVLGVFLLGLTRWRLSGTRATFSLVFGIGLLLGVHLAGGLAWTWYTLLGAAATVATGAVLSRGRGSAVIRRQGV